VNGDLRLQDRAGQIVVAAAIALLDQPERGIDERGQVQVGHRTQTGLGALGGELTVGVTALVAQETIVVVVGTGARRHDDRGPAARAQDAGHLRQRPPVVGDVLQQIGADDGVDGAVGDRQLAGVGAQQPR
jgi:hypothetical protein